MGQTVCRVGGVEFHSAENEEFCGFTPSALSASQNLNNSFEFNYMGEARLIQPHGNADIAELHFVLERARDT